MYDAWWYHEISERSIRVFRETSKASFDVHGAC